MPSKTIDCLIPIRPLAEIAERPAPLPTATEATSASDIKRRMIERFTECVGLEIIPNEDEE